LRFHYPTVVFCGWSFGFWVLMVLISGLECFQQAKK